MLVDSTNGSQKSGVKVAELLNMDMKGKVILNVKFSSKPGWSLRTYKVMPTYRVQIQIIILCLDFVCNVIMNFLPEKCMSVVCSCSGSVVCCNQDLT